jgi:hypothetical protein
VVLGVQPAGAWVAATRQLSIVERRRCALDDAVARRGVAELGQRVVAHEEGRLGEALPARDGEVPRQVERLAGTWALASCGKMCRR